MARDGFSFERAEVDMPTGMATGGKHLFALLPEHLRMKVPEGRLLQLAYMIGVSDDGGESWKFFDPGESDGVGPSNNLLRMYPEFPSSLAPPPTPKPELIRGG